MTTPTTAPAATSSTDLLAGALLLAGGGWRVHPLHGLSRGRCSCSAGGGCESPGKHPRLKGWKGAATNDPEALRAWWAQWPEANVGLATGEGSGLDVLDLDGAEGLGSLAELEAKHGALPETVAVETGSGGRHFYFRRDAARPFGSKVRLAPGVDTRGDGGNVVAPPSLHASGRRYTWLPGRSPEDVPLAAAPPWLLELAQAKGGGGPKKPATPRPSSPAPAPRPEAWPAHYVAAAVEEELARVAKAGEGGRNDALNESAFRLGRLEAGGAPIGDAFAQLRQAAIGAGLSESETAKTLASGRNAGLLDPRDPPEPRRRATPAGALPPSLPPRPETKPVPSRSSAAASPSPDEARPNDVAAGVAVEAALGAALPLDEARAEENDAEALERARELVRGLPAKVLDDAGAPFEPAALAALRLVRSRDPAEWARVRTALKGQVDLRTLDRETKPPPVESDAKGSEGLAQLLVQMALERCEFFHDSTGKAMATVPVQLPGAAEHMETWPVRSTRFKGWLVQLLYSATQKVPGQEPVGAALNLFEAHAASRGDVRPVFLRVGKADGKVYLDLGDPTWRAVEVDADGWRVVSSPPVHFRRTRGMTPLPDPVAGGSLEALWPLVNVPPEARILVAAWLVAALRPTGPFAVLVVNGQQGSAKSFLSRVLRSLVDPARPETRRIPKDPEKLATAGENVWVLAFDNLSSLPADVSDTLCSIAGGGGFAARTLYTDGEETLFDFARPFLLNGIPNVAERPDLAERSVLVTLPRIPEEERREEAELLAALEPLRPALLGALLDGVACALRRISTTPKPECLPRMADFARWAVAAEEGLGFAPGSFVAAFRQNRQESTEDAIEASPVAVAVRRFAERPEPWTGTAAELLAELEELVPEATRRLPVWPKAPKALSQALGRIAPALRVVGVEVAPGKRTKTERPWTVSRLASGSGDASTGPGDAAGDASSVTRNPLTGKGMGEGDAGDASSPYSSGADDFMSPDSSSAPAPELSPATPSTPPKRRVRRAL